MFDPFEWHGDTTALAYHVHVHGVLREFSLNLWDIPAWIKAISVLSIPLQWVRNAGNSATNPGPSWFIITAS